MLVITEDDPEPDAVGPPEGGLGALLFLFLGGGGGGGRRDLRILTERDCTICVSLLNSLLCFLLIL